MNKFLSFFGLGLVFIGGLYAQSVHWEPTGGFSGGRPRWLATGPNDEVFTSINDSLYMSTDRGAHWKDISGNLGQGGFSAIACASGGTLIAAKYRPYMAGGIFRSTDGGASWQHVVGKSCSDIQISNDGLIYAIATDSLSRDGVYVSSDTGQTWKYSYFETGLLSISPNGTVFLNRDDGIYGLIFRSTDQGKSWVKLPLTTADPKLRLYGAVRRIVFTSNGDCCGTFYNDSKDPYSLCKSTDNGNTWDYLDKINFPNSAGSMQVMTNSTDELIAVKNDICYRSNDAGKQWVKLGKIDGSYLLSHASDTKGTWYMGTMANIYRNDAGSDQFTTASPTMGIIRKIVSDNHGNLIASIWIKEPKYYSDSSGVYWGSCAFAYSTDAGNYWNFNIQAPYMNFGSPVITSLHADQDTLVITIGDDHNYYTTNGGRSWDQWPFFVSWDRYIREVTPVKYGRVYYVHSLNGPEVVFDSGRHGRSFSHDPNLPGEVKKPHYLTIARSPDDYIFLGMYRQIAYMKDGDSVWNRCDIPGLDDSVHQFHFVGNKMYAVTSFNGIFESSTRGAEWAPVNTGLTSLTVRQLISDPRGNLYVATKDGVFRRKAGAQIWENINSNIGSLDVTTLCYVPKDGLYAGTRGSGIFFAKFEPMEDVEPQQMPQQLRLSYDRTKSSLRARYSLEDPTATTISILNVLGVVHWQTNQWSSGGENELSIPINNLPNGFYLLRLSTNDFSATAPFVK